MRAALGRSSPSHFHAPLVVVATVSAALLMVVAAGAADVFRVIRLMDGPVAVRSVAEASLLPIPQTLDNARSASGLPLPSSAELGDGWTLRRTELMRTSIEWVQLVYARNADELRVWVSPLGAQPVVAGRGARTEQIQISGQPVMLLFGDAGPVGPPPTDVSVVNLGDPARRIRAVFEHGNSMVLMIGDDRSLNRAGLVLIVEMWLRTST